ncbi:MAG: hypothetical protein HC913_12245 [Microscillaceae bacterium]|nr:hypothetical protein [Microscillaceae bacterium]
MSVFKIAQSRLYLKETGFGFRQIAGGQEGNNSNPPDFYQDAGLISYTHKK